MPDELLNYVLAQLFHISPLAVEKWTYYEKRRYLCISGEAKEGMEYRRKIENFKRQPNEYEPSENDGW